MVLARIAHASGAAVLIAPGDALWCVSSRTHGPTHVANAAQVARDGKFVEHGGRVLFVIPATETWHVLDMATALALAMPRRSGNDVPLDDDLHAHLTAQVTPAADPAVSLTHEHFSAVLLATHLGVHAAIPLLRRLETTYRRVSMVAPEESPFPHIYNPLRQLARLGLRRLGETLTSRPGTELIELTRARGDSGEPPRSSPAPYRRSERPQLHLSIAPGATVQEVLDRLGPPERIGSPRDEGTWEYDLEEEECTVAVRWQWQKRLMRAPRPVVQGIVRLSPRWRDADCHDHLLAARCASE